MPWRFEGRVLKGPEGQEYPAISGPHGRGRLPSGEYEIGEVDEVEGTHPNYNSYLDETGKAWWVPLKPRFKTDRYGLGIHPDGNVIGTLGCIGVRSKDTRQVYEELKKAKGDALIVP
jgi:hypothetical protein